MPRAGPRKVQRYSLEFKLKTVKLSQLKGVEVQVESNVEIVERRNFKRQVNDPTRTFLIIFSSPPHKSHRRHSYSPPRRECQ